MRVCNCCQPDLFPGYSNCKEHTLTVRHKCLLGVAGTDNDVVEVRV